MPVTAGQNPNDISQRAQYAKGGIGRSYWDMRDDVTLAHCRGERILDAGCGEGITLEKMAHRFPEAQVQGIDADPENVRICNAHKLKALQADLTALPFADATFDTCVFMEVIEHLEHPDEALAELARITKPGGRIAVVYPLDLSMFLARLLCFKFKEATFDPGHLRQWNAIALSRLLRRSGYRVVARRGMPWFWPFMLHGLVVGEKTS